MTDLMALAIAFPGNLEAKIINIHRRYFGYLIFLKYEFLKFRSHISSAIFFQNNSKIIFLLKPKHQQWISSICGSIPRES